jgi:lysophospholipase L1-like esterase
VSGRLGRVAGVVAVNVAVAGLLLLVLEGAVRLLRPDIQPAGTEADVLLDDAFVDAEGATVGLRPGAEGVANGAAVHVDADGFHVYAGNGAVPDSAGAWLWLGDSVLFGVGVPADSTVAGRLALRQDTARVLNPAVIGWGPADYRRRLDAALAAGLRPDRVTVLWCLNDALPPRPLVAPDAPASATLWAQTRAWLNVHSRLYRWAKDAALDRPARYFAHDRVLYETLASADRPEAPIDQALRQLWAIRDTLSARGIPLDVVVAPYEPQLRPGSRAPQQALVPLLESRGIPTLDLLDAFAEVAEDDPSALYLWSDGIHFSSRGHAVAARAVAGWRPYP